MDKCDLHTILRLPTGIFYAQGVKTNVLFFSRGKKDTGNTKAVWVYDMRTNARRSGSARSFTREHFEEFEKAFGDDPLREEQAQGRGGGGALAAVHAREEIAKRGDNLDISWLKDENAQRRGPAGAGGDRGGDTKGRRRTCVSRQGTE
jgi:type I restriction enzyme M protein